MEGRREEGRSGGEKGGGEKGEGEEGVGSRSQTIWSVDKRGGVLLWLKADVPTKKDSSLHTLQPLKAHHKHLSTGSHFSFRV